PVAADAKAGRIARELKIFLEKTTSRSRAHRSRRRRPAISFDDVFAPALTFAVNRLRGTTSPVAKKVLTNSTWDDLRRHLAKRLAFALTPTLRLQQTAGKRSRTTLVRSSPLVKSKQRRCLVSDAKDAGAKKLYLDGIFADDELQKSPGSPAFLFSLGHAGSARANPVSNGSASR